MSYDFIAQLLVPFILVLTRVGAFVMACPVFFPPIVAAQIRVAATVVLTFVLTLTVSRYTEPSSWVLAIVLESMLGMVMGLVIRALAMAIHYAGEIMDNCMGYSFSHTVDPMTGIDTGPIQHISQVIAAVLFFACGGQEDVISTLAEGLRVIPPGNVVYTNTWSEILQDRLGQAFVSGFHIALPVLIAVTCAQLSMVFMAKVAPQLNIFGMGFAITSGGGLIAIWLYLPVWMHTMLQVWHQNRPDMMSLWAY